MAGYSHKKYVPISPMNEYVDYIWKLSFSDMLVSTKAERILPDGGIELFFNLNYNLDLWEFNHLRINEQPWMRQASWIGGQRTLPIETPFPSSINMLGIRFKPHGIRYFFKLGLEELVDHTYWASDMGLYNQNELVERLKNCISDNEQFRLLECLLLSRFRYSAEDEVGKIAQHIISKNGNLRINDLYADLDRASKNFLRSFKHALGITPKKLADIYRFKNILKHVRNFNGHKPDWQNILFQCGYYDQSHFINDFKKFSGTSPSKYFQNRNDYFSHLE